MKDVGGFAGLAEGARGRKIQRRRTESRLDTIWRWHSPEDWGSSPGQAGSNCSSHGICAWRYVSEAAFRPDLTKGFSFLAYVLLIHQCCVYLDIICTHYV